jgi:hypothetical protein
MVQSIEPNEKEISLSVPGEDNIIVQLTTPAEGVKLSGYAVVLGPGGCILYKWHSSLKKKQN